MSIDTSNENKRRYIPSVGTNVRLRLWDDYLKARTGYRLSGDVDPHIWGNFHVTAIESDTALAAYAPSPADRSKDVGEFRIPLAAIEPPIGWKPQYTIYCQPDKVEQVLSWFARGIRVKTDHALDRLAGDCFMPADVDTAPSWGYGEADMVASGDCPKVFSVTAYVEQEFHMPKDPWLRARYKRDAARNGWKIWNRNYGSAGVFWYRSKEVPVYVAGEGHKTPIGMMAEYVDMALTPPLTPLDLLSKLHDSVLVGSGIGDTVAQDAEREALRRGDPIPRWILSRAQYYLDGYAMEYGHNSPAGPTRSGNSTWMFDPSPDAKDPINRKGDK